MRATVALVLAASAVTTACVPAAHAVDFAPGATAARVIGSAATSIPQRGALMDRSFEAPRKVQMDAAGRVLVADSGGNRIGIFNAFPASDGAAFDTVVGSPDKHDHRSLCGAARVRDASSAHSAGGRMVAADRSGYRVLLYDTIPSSDGAPASRILGQTSTGACSYYATSSSSLYSPADVWTDGTRVVVADPGRHRVLIWNSWPTANNQPADLVLGQPDFTSATSNNGGVSAMSMSGPASVWSDGTRLLVADGYNNRVLVWNSWPTVNRDPADLVLGQAGFATTSSGCSATAMATPTSVSSNGTRIVVAMSSTTVQRVLAWNAWPTANGAPAAFVLGDTALATCTVNDLPGTATLREPGGVFTDGTRVLVGDTGNNRVLAWTAWPTASGQAATRVLGQTNGTSAGPFAMRANNPVISMGSPAPFWGGLLAEVDPTGGLWVLDGLAHHVLRFASTPTTDQPPASFIHGQPDETFTWCNGATATVTATSLCRPYDMWTDGTRYLVADTGNHRVLVWNAPPTGPTDAPDFVLGQATFTTRSAAGGATGMDEPTGVTSDGTRIAVADNNNHRVLVWNSWPTVNGQAASLVLGQPDFTSTSSNNGGVSASSLGSPIGVASADGRLAVADEGGRRILLWSAWPTTSFQAATGVYGQESMTRSDCGLTCSLRSVELVSNALLFTNSCEVFVLDPAPIASAVETGQREVGNGCTSSSTLGDAIGSPSGLGARAGALWIADAGNARVVRFDDTVDPTITDPPRALVDGNSATVRWRTSESGIASVHWDTISRASIGLYSNSTSGSTATGLEHALTMTGLTSGTWYYRVVTTDWAGRQVVSSEYTFTVGGPTIVDNQPGDVAWRRANLATYDVDVSDADGLDRVELRVWTQPGQSGSMLVDWMVAFTNPASPFAADWSLPSTVWDALPEGTSYVTVRAWDDVARWTLAEDVFSVRKDTSISAPANVIDGTTVDEATRISTTTLEASWTSLAGEDVASGLDRFDYCFASMPGCAGTVLVGWTSAGTATTILRSGLSLAVGQRWYAGVRAVDAAGNVSAVVSSDGVLIGSAGGTTSISTSGCTSNDAIGLGTVFPGSTSVTSADCQVAFGASGGTAELRMHQSDLRGVAASTQTTGALDPGFADGGRVEVDGLGDWDEEYGHGLTVLRDGRILRAADRSPATLSVVRFTQDGRLDRTFGSDGWASVPGPGYASASSVIEQPDGKLLLCGSLWATTPDRMIVARLQPDGAIDTSFGGGSGYVTHSTNADTASTWLSQCRQQRDGRILLVGYQTGVSGDDIVVKRLLSDGSVDTSYGGGDGIVAVATRSDTMYNFFGYGAELDHQERLVIAGNQWNTTSSSLEYVIMRVTSAGVLDPSYAGGDGIWSWDFSSGDDRAQDLVVHPDGSVTAVGTTRDFDAYGLVQLDPTGAPDAGFGGSGTGRTEHVFNADGWTEAFTIARQPDGRLLVGGLACQPGCSASDSMVHRLLADGSIDTSFADAGLDTYYDSFYQSVTGIELAPDGSIVVAATGGNASTVMWRYAAGTPLRDYDGSWANGGFGACLRDAGAAGAGIGSWSATGTCGATDSDPWHGIAARIGDPGSRVAVTTATGATTTASFRFGVRPVPSQPVGAYHAPVTFEVISPAL